MTKRIFVSDIHMTTGLSLNSAHPYDWLTVEQAKSFLQFLEFITNDGFDQLILVGDILDDWVYPVERQPPGYQGIVDAPAMTINRQIIDKIASIAKDKPVKYLVGNHDITITASSLAAFRETTFPGVEFDQSYDADGLFAEHGNNYVVWNAPDPCKNDLPIGHYITRLNASLAEMGGGQLRWQDALGPVLLDLMGSNQDVNIPVDYLSKKCGFDEKTADIKTVDGGTMSIDQVKALYPDLEHRWKNEGHYYPGLGHQAAMEATSLGLDEIAQLVAKTRDRKVVIFGHTHLAKLHDASSADRIGNRTVTSHEAVYANTGSWCTGQGGREPQCSYVIDEYESGMHKVTLVYWVKGGPEIQRTMTV